jgi:hypothetical protein
VLTVVRERWNSRELFLIALEKHSGWGDSMEVRFGHSYQPCTITGNGICRDCHEPICWGQLPSGKYVPLDRDPEEPGVMRPHFASCRHARPRDPSRGRDSYRNRNAGYAPPRPAPPPPVTGIQIGETRWRLLVRLCHPDKHHGGADECLANDLTAWLLEQRPRLTKN